MPSSELTILIDLWAAGAMPQTIGELRALSRTPVGVEGLGLLQGRLIQ